MVFLVLKSDVGILTSGGAILRDVLRSKSRKTRPYRKREHHITVRSVKKDPPDPALYVRAILGLAMERHGLTPTWTRPELDALLAEYGSDGRVGDTKPSTDPRK
jgi:hypothetical protein